LAAGAGAAAASGFVPGFLESAFAQTTAAPKRFVMIYMPNSNLRDSWLSTGGRNVTTATGDATQFTLNKHTMPLQPIQANMTLIHGINMDNMVGDLHSSAQIRVTTGADVVMPSAGPGGGNLPGGPSLDTVIAEESPIVAASTRPFKQLVVSADARGLSLHHRCITSDMMNQFVPPDNSPMTVYTRLFANVSVGGTAMEQQAALQKLRARKQSVLDFLKADISRMSSRVPALQRQKLDSHLTSIRALEQSLDSQVVPGSATVTLPTGLETLKPDTSANHPQLVKGFFDIIRTSFQLDLTRVVSFSFGTGNNAVSFADFGGGPSGGVHDIAHLSVNDSTKAMLTTITLWYTARVTEFVQSLAAIPEGTGTMLDNTMILFFSENAQYHEPKDIPLAIIGGKNLGNVGNRVVRYATRQVNDVGLGVLNAFKVPRTTWGDARWFKGVAPELLA
jgi:hypothetical protein